MDPVGSGVRGGSVCGLWLGFRVDRAYRCFMADQCVAGGLASGRGRIAPSGGEYVCNVWGRGRVGERKGQNRKGALTCPRFRWAGLDHFADRDAAGREV